MSEKMQIDDLANDIAMICPDLVESGCGNMNCITCLARGLEQMNYRKQAWISVDERLPEEKDTEQKFYDNESLALLDVEIQRVSDEVLVAVKDIGGGFAFVTMDCTVEGKWQNWESGDYTVTHWMPLPEAPKMKGGE